MAYGMENMANMLARSGMMLGQQIGAPISQFGQNVGGMLSAKIQTDKKQEEAAAVQSLLQQNKDNPAQLTALYQKYASEGKTDLANLFKQAADAAVKKSTANVANMDASRRAADERAKLIGAKVDAMGADLQLMQMQKNVAQSAESLGLPGIAKEARNAIDMETLKEISKQLRDETIKKAPGQTPQIRRSLAKAAGITMKQFADLGLSSVSDEEFKAVVDGQKGKAKAWMSDDGISVYRENDYGMVYDDKQGKWVEPSDLGLKQAPPSVQRVETIASGMADELAKAGAKGFADLAEGAQKSYASLNTINRSLPKIDEMFTGALGQVKLNVAKAASAFGVDIADPNTIANTEVYIAESATRVADYIVNLGAGTGLSDKDKEYAEKVVGGSITADAESLKRLLKILKENAETKIESYNKVYKKVETSLGDNASSVLAFYPSVFSLPTTESAVSTGGAVMWDQLPSGAQ